MSEKRVVVKKSVLEGLVFEFAIGEWNKIFVFAVHGSCYKLAAQMQLMIENSQSKSYVSAHCFFISKVRVNLTTVLVKQNYDKWTRSFPNWISIYK